VRQLAALERELGARLLNRTTRRQSLTEDGRLYLERARRVLADLEEADRLIAVQHAEPSGTLSVTAPVLFGHMHVAPAVARFLQRYPLTRVRLMLIDRVVDLVEEGHDLAVRIAHLPDSTLIAQPVGSVRRVVTASPGWLRRHGSPRHPGDLANLNCLIGADGGRWTFVEGNRAVAVPVRETSNATSQRHSWRLAPGAWAWGASCRTRWRPMCAASGFASCWPSLRSHPEA